MSNEIQLVPSNAEMQTYERIADQASKSGFFSKLGGQAGILSIALYARELGQPPMQMLCGGMHNIMGKIEIAPVTMNGMIRKAGHMLKIVDSNDQKCTIKGIRNDTKEEYSCTYSMDDAKRAGLVKAESGWEKFPSDMLFARCLSRLARRLFPDVIGPSYVEGEIKESIEKEAVEIVESAPIVEKAADPIDAVIGAEKAKILEKMLVNQQEVLKRVLEVHGILNLANLKESDYPVVKKNLEDLLDEMGAK